MSVIFKKPLTIEIGVGITGSLNGEPQSTMSMDASDSVSVTFEIPQEVGPDSFFLCLQILKAKSRFFRT